MTVSRKFSLRAFTLAVVTLASLAGCGGAQSRKMHFLERGRDYVVHEKYDKARVEFRNALQIAPNDPEVRYQSGLVAEKVGAVMEAAQFYQGTIDVQPDHVAARAHLGRLFFLYGSYQSALDTVQPSLAKHPDDPGLLSVRAAARSRLDKDSAAALADAEKAYKLDPHNEDTVAILAGLYMKTGRKDDSRTVLQRGIAQIPNTVALRLGLAQQYLQTEERAKAEQLLKELVALQPKDAGQRINLAHYYSVSNRVTDAEAVLREGVKALPGNQQLRIALVDFLRTRRGAAAAESELTAMSAASPDDDNLRFDLARLYAIEKQPAKAETLYRAVVARNHSSDAVTQAKNYLAEMRLQANDIAGAQALIKEVLTVSPRSNDSLTLRARIELIRGDPKAAIADLRNVLRDQPSSVPTLRALAAAYMANNEPALGEQTLRQAADADPSATAAALDLASLLNRLGKFDEARDVAEALVNREPKNPVFLEAAFRAELGAKNLAAARTSAAALEAAQPDSPVGHYLSGVAEEAAGNSAGALSGYTKALELAPTTREPLEALVRMYAREGKVDLALARLRKTAESQPKNPLPQTIAGELLLAQKKLSEASESFRAAMTLDPTWLPAYRGLAQVQIGQHDTEGAIKTLQSARGKARPAEAVEFDLAGLFQSLGRPDDAIAVYEEALKANPQFDVAANNLAMLLVSSRKDQASLDRALTLAQRFTESSNSLYVDTLGWVRYKRGETSSALSALDKAVSMAPDAPGARYHLAMAQLKSGQADTARDNLQRALKLGNAFEGVADARVALANLQTRTTAARP